MIQQKGLPKDDFSSYKGTDSQRYHRKVGKKPLDPTTLRKHFKSPLSPSGPLHLGIAWNPTSRPKLMARNSDTFPGAFGLSPFGMGWKAPRLLLRSGPSEAFCSGPALPKNPMPEESDARCAATCPTMWTAGSPTAQNLQQETHLFEALSTAACAKERERTGEAKS